MNDQESDFVVVLEPSSRRFTQMAKHRYEPIKEAMLNILSKEEHLTLNELIEAVTLELNDDFRGDLPFYILKVKNDLEARKMILCKTGVGPERNQLIQRRKPARRRSWKPITAPREPGESDW